MQQPDQYRECGGIHWVVDQVCDSGRERVADVLEGIDELRIRFDDLLTCKQLVQQELDDQ
jgi:hypothetical protein